MKKNKIRLLKVRSLLLQNFIRLLSLVSFGFLVSCEKFPDPVAMYGILTPEVEFKGQITDRITQNPIPGISIKITSGNLDTTFAATNEAGIYGVFRYDSYENQDVKLIFTDTDSTLNGKYASKTVDVVVTFRDVNNSEHKENVELTPIP